MAPKICFLAERKLYEKGKDQATEVIHSIEKEGGKWAAMEASLGATQNWPQYPKSYLNKMPNESSFLAQRAL